MIQCALLKMYDYLSPWNRSTNSSHYMTVTLCPTVVCVCVCVCVHAVLVAMLSTPPYITSAAKSKVCANRLCLQDQSKYPNDESSFSIHKTLNLQSKIKNL